MPDALLCGIKADAGLFQLFAVHDQIARPVGGFNLHRNVQLLRELLCRVHHIFRIGAAKVVHAAGQAQCRSKVCDHLSDIGHAPAVVGRKGHRRPMQGGAQKVQRQVAPDGQPVARQIIHPAGPQQHSVRAEFQHALFHFQFAAAIYIGRLQRQCLRQRPGLRDSGIDLI